MKAGRAAEWTCWVLVAHVLLGEILFGSTALRFGSDFSPRVQVRGLFFGLTLLIACCGLLMLPRARWPSRGWCFALLALPAWLCVQMIPLPLEIVRVLSPARVELLEKVWSGPVFGCDASLLVSGKMTGWIPLSTDATLTGLFLVQTLAAVAAFALSRGVFVPGSAQRRIFLSIVIAFTTAEALYGIVQWAADTPMVLWIVKTSEVGSASGTLINRNHFAALLYLGMGCALTALASRTVRGEVAQHLRSRELALRTSLAAVIGIQLAGIIASQSRAGLSASMLLLLLGGLMVGHDDRWIRRLTIVMLAVIVVPALILVGPSLVSRFADVSSELSASGGRLGVLLDSLNIVRDYPVFGTGGGSFEWVFSTYRGPGIGGRYTYAHNDYLQLLVECGAIGLLLAGLPVAMFIHESVRFRSSSRQGDDARSQLWPLWIAMALLAAHEFVDFNLQIPAQLVLFALIAGSATARIVSGEGTRWTPVLAVAGLLAVPFATLHSAAQWPVFLDQISWPSVPEAYHLRHRIQFLAWRDDNDRFDSICGALHEESQAQRLRPLSGRFASDQARVSAIAFLHPRIESADLRSKLERQALRATDVARIIDPWNRHDRLRLMEISLSLGALDRVSADARLLAGSSRLHARGAIRSLRRAGMPPTMIAELVGNEVEAMRALLQWLIEDEEWEPAMQLVPADVSAGPALCRIGGHVAAVLDRGHGVSTEPFLRGCLSLDAIQQDPALEDYVRVWLANARILAGAPEEARDLAGEIRPGVERTRLELRIANREEDWEHVIPLTHALLEDPTLEHSPFKEAELLFRLGEAYAHLGKRALALRQLRRALELDPTLPGVEKAIRELERGEMPF